MFGGSDPGTHEEHRGAQRPRREDDLPRPKDHCGAIGFGDLRSDRAAAFECEATHRVVAQDPQVAAATHASVEIAAAAGCSGPLETAVRQGAMPVAEIGICILNMREPAMRRRRAHGVRQRRPRCWRLPSDGYRPIVTMGRPVEILIRLEPAKDRQHTLPSPTRRAETLPLIVVFRQTPQRPHAVDGGAAAENLALRQGERG